MTIDERSPKDEVVSSAIELIDQQRAAIRGLQQQQTVLMAVCVFFFILLVVTR